MFPDSKGLWTVHTCFTTHTNCNAWKLIVQSEGFSKSWIMNFHPFQRTQTIKQHEMSVNSYLMKYSALPSICMKTDWGSKHAYSYRQENYFRPWCLWQKPPIPPLKAGSEATQVSCWGPYLYRETLLTDDSEVEPTMRLACYGNVFARCCCLQCSPVTVQWGCSILEPPCAYLRQLCSLLGQHPAPHAWAEAIPSSLHRQSWGFSGHYQYEAEVRDMLLLPGGIQVVQRTEHLAGRKGLLWPSVDQSSREERS